MPLPSLLPTVPRFGAVSAPEGRRLASPSRGSAAFLSLALSGVGCGAAGPDVAYTGSHRDEPRSWDDDTSGEVAIEADSGADSSDDPAGDPPERDTGTDSSGDTASADADGGADSGDPIAVDASDAGDAELAGDGADARDGQEVDGPVDGGDPDADIASDADGYPGPLRNGQRVSVGFVIDADTLDVVVDDWFYAVRLAGVAAPECTKERVIIDGHSHMRCTGDDEYYGLQAYRVTLAWADGVEAILTCDDAAPDEPCPLDTYDRVLAYLELPGGGDLGEAIISSGAAFSYTRYASSRRASYCLAEAQAETESAGMWADLTQEELLAAMSASTRSWYEDHDARCRDAIDALP